MSRTVVEDLVRGAAFRDLSARERIVVTAAVRAFLGHDTRELDRLGESHLETGAESGTRILSVRGRMGPAARRTADLFVLPKDGSRAVRLRNPRGPVRFETVTGDLGYEAVETGTERTVLLGRDVAAAVERLLGTRIRNSGHMPHLGTPDLSHLVLSKLQPDSRDLRRCHLCRVP